MISKEVCQKCFKGNYSTGIAWGSSDDHRWNFGEVDCPILMYKTRWLSVKDGPPKGCPYMLEHGIAMVGTI